MDATNAAAEAVKDPADTGHVYDGIHEHDNRLPRWWLVTLWGAIGFAVAYWLAYHTFDVLPLPRAQLQAELAAMAARHPAPSDAAIASLRGDAAAIERGRAVFATTCMPCHGDKGQGVVGPNLTDDAWLHGHEANEIMKVVADGVLAKGMPAWQPVLGPDKVRDVTAFVLTLQGTHVPGKAPEGVPKG
jgi:cytochrome c oxidase cbb3-type subunit 3